MSFQKFKVAQNSAVCPQNSLCKYHSTAQYSSDCECAMKSRPELSQKALDSFSVSVTYPCFRSETKLGG